MSGTYLKLSPKGMGLACGILWALAMVFIVILTLIFDGYGKPFIDFMGHFYIGYEATVKGAVIGAVWGFVDTAIAGFLIAWLYNFFVCKD